MMPFALIPQAIAQMIEWNQGDPRRIHHFLKVYAFAKTIGELEGLDEQTQFTLETAAVLHDIGIKPAEAKYGSTAGPLQEKEGAPAAHAMLMKLQFPEDVIQRVTHLVGHHHTYGAVDGIDFQILVEADFLVNAFEDDMSIQSIQSVEQKLFRTASGRKLLQQAFQLS